MNYLNKVLVDVGDKKKVRGKTNLSAKEIKSGIGRAEFSIRELKFALEKKKLLEQIDLLNLLAFQILLIFLYYVFKQYFK